MNIDRKSQFLEQVQILMKIQQLKNEENIFFNKSNYMWLRRKKITVVWISTRDELKILEALSKITKEQEIDVMKQLLTFIDKNPEATFLKIPEITLNLINDTINKNTIEKVTLSRMQNFRNSLRKLSLMSNNNKHDSLNVKVTVEQRRSVTFNEIPVVYRIKY